MQCALAQRLLLGTHVAYPRRDGQAELIWMMPSCAPMWFSRPKTVTHPGTNRGWRRVTTLIATMRYY